MIGYICFFNYMCKKKGRDMNVDHFVQRIFEGVKANFSRLCLAMVLIY